MTGKEKVPKPRNANVPETIFVNVFDNCQIAYRTKEAAERQGCAYATETYVLPCLPSREAALKEAVVKAAMEWYFVKDTHETPKCRKRGCPYCKLVMACGGLDAEGVKSFRSLRTKSGRGK